MTEVGKLLEKIVGPMVVIIRVYQIDDQVCIYFFLYHVLGGSNL